MQEKIVLNKPMPAPTMIRPARSRYLSPAIPIQRAPTVNTTLAPMITGLLPKRSFRNPPIGAKRAAAATVTLTMYSCQTSESWNSFRRRIIAPEITPVSYPNRNPPRAEKKVNTYTNPGVLFCDERLSIFKLNFSSSASSYRLRGLLAPLVVVPFEDPANIFTFVCVILLYPPKKSQKIIPLVPPFSLGFPLCLRASEVHSDCYDTVPKPAISDIGKPKRLDKRFSYRSQLLSTEISLFGVLMIPGKLTGEF